MSGPPATAGREGQTFAGAGALARYASFVKLPHTLFALPFALVGVVLASTHRPVTAGVAAWIVVAFTAARFAAMAFNRIVDRALDARNPRTAARELPAGRIGLVEAQASVVVASVVFVVAAWRINPLCLTLSPLALAWVLGYSYTKRFTRWAHVVLGVGLAIAPAGGYLAVTGAWSEPWWMLVALTAGVAAWVGGFDILYALQDVEFDRAEGLHSIPALLGEARAVALARAHHVMTVVALAIAGLGAGAGGWWFAGVAVVAGLLAYEHRLVSPADLSRLDAAFFRMNGIISVTFFGFALLDRILA